MNWGEMNLELLAILDCKNDDPALLWLVRHQPISEVIIGDLLSYDLILGQYRFKIFINHKSLFPISDDRSYDCVAKRLNLPRVQLFKSYFN
jgi:hypothetical protein